MFDSLFPRWHALPVPDYASPHEIPAPTVYQDGIANWIAGRYASGEPETSLADLHRADPEHIPAPLFIRRWRKERPAFDALMIEAEQCRAEALFDQCLSVADDPQLVAASARVATDVRFRMAESLDSGRYGKKVELSARLSWDQLVAQSLETVRVDTHAAIGTEREPIEHDSGGEGGTPKDAQPGVTRVLPQISAAPPEIPVHIPESATHSEKISETAEDIPGWLAIEGGF